MFFAGYLPKFMFLRRCRIQKLDPFLEFCRMAGKLYDPLNPPAEIQDVDEDETDDEIEQF